ncbi:MAG TPA: flagellar FliJ family protein [Bryobacteraceae bacterium]
MKAWQFRLEAALRWRATQLRVAQESAAAAARRVTAIEREIGALYGVLRRGGRELAPSGSAAFQTWDAYVNRARRRITFLEGEMWKARGEVTAAKQKVLEAHRSVRVLENLRDSQHGEWVAAFNREMDAFADEAFSAGLVRARARIEGRTGA